MNKACIVGTVCTALGDRADPRCHGIGSNRGAGAALALQTSPTPRVHPQRRDASGVARQRGAIRLIDNCDVLIGFDQAACWVHLLEKC